MKRKLIDNESDTPKNSASSESVKRRLVTPFAGVETRKAFRENLFEPETRNFYRNAYESSTPYPHAVVTSLIEPTLLKAVRTEITSHISFTLKETDIYRIHQSGDLANLSNLDPESLAYLPSLVHLRDALYSHDFCSWVSEVTGAGKLSGLKTDMAINVYTPGSYLLCHDDVIGSRRVSYILYLTDPDSPWKAEWGGGLRLYPTETRTDKKGAEVKVPLPEHSVNIPPAFGQLSFFAVKPGESYHDVEEVYHPISPGAKDSRIRMAISGWYHIPQKGEDGFKEGAEESQAQKSSLAQLKGAADEFDEPRLELQHFDEPRTVFASDAKTQEVDPGEESDPEEDSLTEQDLTFLLDYISPSFLTPDMTEKLAASFEENSFLQLNHMLRDRFAKELRQYIQTQEAAPSDSDSPTEWRTARPPHKHRFLYLQNPVTGGAGIAKGPITRLLVDLLRSHAFKKWLGLITGFNPLTLIKQSAVARRFRRGKDYALASGYSGETPRIEFTIGMTPTKGWDGPSKQQQHDKRHARHGVKGHSKKKHANGEVKVDQGGHVEFGGEEVYMAGDDDDEEDTDSVHSKSLPQVGKKADPAVYKSANDDGDDGILFTNSATWNQFSVVLRDRGTLRFVKYVSQAASGGSVGYQREVELAPAAFDGEEGEEDDNGDDGENGDVGDDEEEEHEEDEEEEN